MKKTIVAALSVAVLLATSCSKTKDTPSPNYSSVQSALAEVAPKSVTTQINVPTGASFRSASGVEYLFPSNAFITATGSMVIDSVAVATTEYLSKADMILSGVLPVQNGNALISGGAAYIRAMRNDKEVYMAAGKSYTVTFPQKNTPLPGMGLYSSGSSPAAPGAINWQLNADSSHGSIMYSSSSISIVSDLVHFTNAGLLLPYANYQSFTVTVKTKEKPVTGELLMYAVYDDFNCVWKMGSGEYGYGSNSGGIVAETHVLNAHVHFVAATIIDGRLYGGVLATTPETGVVYNMSLSEKTPTAFKAMISGL